MRTNLRSFAETDEDEERTLRALLGEDMPESTPLPPQRAAAPAPAMEAPRDMPAERMLERDDPEPEQSMVDSDGFDWQLVAGLLLDAGLNKGRGLGQLVGAYANNREAASRQKQQHKLRLEEIAARKGDRDFAEWQATDASQRDWNSQELRKKALELTERGVGVRETSEQRQGEKFTQQQDPDSKLLSAGVEVAKRKAGANVEGREEKKAEMADTIEANAAGVARARTDAVTDAKNANPLQRTPGQVIDDERADAQLEETKRSRAVTEALHKETKRQGELNSFRDKNKRLLQLAQSMQHIDQILAKPEYQEKGADLPGMGATDSREWMHPWGLGQSPDDMAMRKDLDLLGEYLQTEITGAAAPISQEQRIRAIAGAKQGATEDQTKVALEILRDHFKNELRMAGAGREDVAREVLGNAPGLDRWVYGDDQAPPEARIATPQSRAVNPLDGARELPLPVSGNVPKLPNAAAANGAKKTRTLKLPSGRTIKAALSDEELQTALARGATEL